MDFQETSYVSIFRKSLEKIQVSLYFDKNNGYITQYLRALLTVSLLILLRMRIISGKVCRENQNKSYMQFNIFPKIVTF